ncbi:MAG: hypothetical protein ABIT96_07520 [Ferruginibacter sp.]
MSLEEFEKEKLSERDKGFIRMRSLMDLGMGVLWVSMGIFLIFIKYFHTGLEEKYDDITMKIFGVVCVIYGSFRIYRGYKKNYLKDR